MKSIRALSLLTLCLLAPVVQAAGYTSWAVPTQVEMVNGGALIAGAFGDPNACGVANFIYVPKTNGFFKEIVAMALTAIATGREMSFYSGSCAEVSFHWAGNVINQSLEGQGAFLR